MKLYVLALTTAPDGAREYFMPWYTDHMIFDSEEKRNKKIDEILSHTGEDGHEYEYITFEENIYTFETELL